MVECMVALLRARSYASSNDVQLYLKDYKGLMYKMNNVDPGLISEESVKANEAKIQDLHSYFTDDKSADFKINAEFIHLFAWTQHFCTLCNVSRGV